MNSFTLPSSSIVKIFPSEKELDAAQQKLILENLNDFLSKWKAHGVSLAAEAKILFNRFVVVAVNDKVELPSGCSIDSLFRFVSALENEMGINLKKNSYVFVEQSGKVVSVPFNKVSELQVSDNDKVFNLLCSTVEDLQKNFVQLPKESSYSRLFSL